MNHSDESASRPLAGSSEDLEGRQQRRRTFLKGSGLLAAGVAVAPGLGTPTRASAMESPKFSNLQEPVGRTLVRMARDIFPHDKVPDALYAAAIAPYDQKTAEDPALRSLLVTGVAQLDEKALARYGKRYAEIPGEVERVSLLYAIEQSAFFQRVRGDLIFTFYNNKDVWPLFGYEGSSYEKGGYLNRGFNDIDWL